MQQNQTENKDRREVNNSNRTWSMGKKSLCRARENNKVVQKIGAEIVKEIERLGIRD